MVKYCPRCGTPNDDDANFCIKCGYRFPVQQTPQAPPPSGQPQQPYPSKHGSKPRIAIDALAVIGLMLLVFIIFSSLYSVIIANEALSLSPGSYVYFTVEVPWYAIHPAFKISFTVTGGTGNDIRVCNEGDYGVHELAERLFCASNL